MDESLIQNPIDIHKEIEPGSLVVFDDVDTFSDPKIINAINKLKADILETGRHANIPAVITSHLINPNDRKAGRLIMNEMTTMTIFPRGGGSKYQQKYCLKNYLGYSNKEIDKLLKINSRWITFSKNFPQYILTESKAFIIN